MLKKEGLKKGIGTARAEQHCQGVGLAGHSNPTDLTQKATQCHVRTSALIPIVLLCPALLGNLLLSPESEYVQQPDPEFAQHPDSDFAP
eukprot:1156527-Pelagomonas_calceolata.AAC.4